MPEDALTSFTVSDAYQLLVCGLAIVIEVRK